MTLFYDPKTRKAKPWIMVAFVLVPILVIGMIWFYGEFRKSQKDNQTEQEKDIFG